MSSTFANFITIFSYNTSVKRDEHKEFDDKGRRPRDSVGKIETLNGMVLLRAEHCVYPADTHSAYSEDCNYHRQVRRTETAYKTGSNVHETAQEVGDTYICHTYKTVFYGFIGIRDVEREQLAAEESGCAACDKSCEENGSQRDNCDVFQALVFVCAVVLTGEVHGSLLEGIHRSIDETLDICGG